MDMHSRLMGAFYLLYIVPLVINGGLMLRLRIFDDGPEPFRFQEEDIFIVFCPFVNLYSFMTLFWVTWVLLLTDFLNWGQVPDNSEDS